jgi:hypothetical protein
MPLPPKDLPDGYTLLARGKRDPYVYVRPDGTRSRAYDRRIRAVDAAWIEDGMRKATARKVLAAEGAIGGAIGGAPDGTL